MEPKEPLGTSMSIKVPLKTFFEAVKNLDNESQGAFVAFGDL